MPLTPKIANRRLRLQGVGLLNIVQAKITAFSSPTPKSLRFPLTFIPELVEGQSDPCVAPNPQPDFCIQHSKFRIRVRDNARMFNSVTDISRALLGQQYLASDEIATTVFLAENMGKPVLAEGPAGVGKTELAKAWAGASGRELIRLQCYEGLDESKTLYEWEYAKQMLYTQLLRDKLSETLGGAL